MISLTQSLRALLKRQGVSVHAVIPGTVDTDMTRGYDFPKVSPEFAAAGIFEGVEKGEGSTRWMLYLMTFAYYL